MVLGVDRLVVGLNVPRNQLLPSHRDVQRVPALLHQKHRLLGHGPEPARDWTGRLVCDGVDQ